ncbi:Bacterial extracellular solute-binding protein [Actinomyces bovis]|uniref:Bacterial extracellular solute-binding protein n=1 Tax=Actinomyces bovis TaxID=1658 RepID=A0ABY1VPK0_9ACTO|nr:ABC transporter substrate-binding protein [Actinomyces bovis]SPT53723.1 Bacterial extracellular solute-binding protein [Actinomyces bovis]VEG55877.1 Bacterial extracellular solute-binding protein [Actinomyces israelii]
MNFLSTLSSPSLMLPAKRLRRLLPKDRRPDAILLGRLRRGLRVGAVVGLAATILASCAALSPAARGPLPTGAAACKAISEQGFPARSLKSHHSVKVATAFSKQEAARFDESVKAFEECTGIDIVQEATNELESKLRAIDPGTVSPGWRTDLAVVPQPGLARDLAELGVTAPLPRSVQGNVELGWDRTWADVAKVDDVAHAAPLLASVKSFVWYSPHAFAKAGYQVPSSWAGLKALTAKVVADHPSGDVQPWCLGISDGGASGWPLSDWLEEVLLTTKGSTAYDQWARHQVPLDDSNAVEALKQVESLVLTEGHVTGNRQGALSTTVEFAGQQLAQGSCLMLHASSAYETLLPEGTTVLSAQEAEAGTPADPKTLDAFPFPVTGPDDPVLVGGDYLVRVATSYDTQDPSGALQEPTGSGHAEAVTTVMRYLTSADWVRRRVALGGVTTGSRAVQPEDMTSAVGRRATAKLQSRQVAIRFDASDSMPSKVGTATLWEALVAWAGGSKTAEAALKEAEESWPKR